MAEEKKQSEPERKPEGGAKNAGPASPDDDSENAESAPAGGRPAPWLSWIVFFLAAMMLISLLQTDDFAGGQGQTITFSRFRSLVEEGQVAKVEVQGEKVQGSLKTEVEPKGPGETEAFTQFNTHLPAFAEEEIYGLLKQNNVEIASQPASDGLPIGLLLINLLPLLVFIVIGYMIYRSMRGRGQELFSVAKSKARLYEAKQEKTTFDDVAGSEQAKVELNEVVAFLKNPSQFHDVGARSPKGVLLMGAPGTGKTLLARAVAGESDVPFYSISGSDFMQMFVGVGASRVRDMFKEAKKKSPAIIFIDELDSIGRQRGAGLGGGHDEREQTLNQLLSEMDGFEPNENVVVMAATNRPDILDSALLRPGRFDRQITVQTPTESERLAILKVHARNKRLAKDVDLRVIARKMRGVSGAQLEHVLNEAAMLAARAKKKVIEQKEVSEALDKILLGLKREGVVITPEESRLLAYHESGHALLSLLIPEADMLDKVSIIPRGQTMGVTHQLPENDRYIYKQDYMEARLAIMVGGRTAEQLVFGTYTTGSASDLREATKLARKMVLEWGMSREIGPMAPGGDQENVFLGRELAQHKDYSEATAQRVDDGVRALLDAASRRAEDILTAHRGELDKLAEALVEREELTAQQVRTLLGYKESRSA